MMGETTKRPTKGCEPHANGSKANHEWGAIIAHGRLMKDTTINLEDLYMDKGPDR